MRQSIPTLSRLFALVAIWSALAVAQPAYTQRENNPRARIHVEVQREIVVMDALRSEPSTKTGAPIARYEWRAHEGNAYPLVLASNQSSLDREPATDSQVQIRAPPFDGEYHVKLRVIDSRGEADESIAVFRMTQGKPRAVDLMREHPLWVDSAVIYGAVPFFFGQQDFESLRTRLDEIAALGATVVWLSPVTGAAPDDFGYAVTDHFRLRDTFGSEKQFRALIDAAHAQGLRVIMDFIPNHFSTHHPFYKDVQRRGTASPYHSWFERDADGKVTHYFDWTHLKNLEYDNPEVQEYMLEAFAFWVREYEVDGFRVDAAWAVRERRPDFWPKWREELKRVDPDLFLLAEASARDAFYVNEGFDATYDWTAKLGEWAWHDVFGKESKLPNLRRLREELTADQHAPLRFINNNDTGVRFIERHGLAQTKLAAAMLFTLPGFPLIYTGDEVGAKYQPYDEGPPIVWKDPYGLTPFYTRLARLRRDHPELASAPLTLLSTDHDDEVLAYKRGDRILVLLNFAKQALEVRLPGAPVPVHLEALSPVACIGDVCYRL